MTTPLTAAAAAAAVMGTAERLRAHGIAAGDRVALCGDNSPEYVITMLALAHLDTSIVLVDGGLAWPQRRAAAVRTGARWLLHDSTDAPDLSGVRVRGYPAEVPSPAEIPLPAAGGPGAERPTLAQWWRREDAAILFSSGTTGPAKPVLRPGPAILDNTLRTQRVMGYRADDVLAPWLPLSHQYGMSIVLLWWLAGATLVTSGYRRLPQAVADLVAHRVTAVDAPPSTYYTLLRLLDRRPERADHLSGVRYWGVGGAPLPRALARQFQDRLGAPLLDGYGLTELGNVALAVPAAPAGCGRPLPGVGVRIRGPEGPAGTGVPGEVEVRWHGQMTGYLRPDRTISRPPVGRWYRTGDLGFLDAAGNLHVLGRRDAVHRHGHTLYPASIERQAEQIAGRPVKVLAVPDQRRGASLVFVVADPAGGSPHRWGDRLRAELPYHEHPNRVCVLEKLPVTTTGKVDLPRLRRQLGLSIPTQ